MIKSTENFQNKKYHNALLEKLLKALRSFDKDSLSYFEYALQRAD